MIRTVLGDLSPDRLGPTACHEHLLIQAGRPVELEPDFLLDDVDAAVREALDLLAAGGTAVVDCMPIGVGRDPDGLVEIARRTGLVVLAVSGFHRDAFYPDGHWVRKLDADELTQEVVDEALVGMRLAPEGPGSGQRSSARAGVIKVATSGLRPTPLESKLLAAAGDAAAVTGLPVLTHTESVAGAEAQLLALERAGVPSSRVILSHMDRHGGAGVAELCASGATVCLDWLGRVDRGSDQRVVDLVVRLLAAGHRDRVVLGQDLARRRYWRAYGGGPGLAHLFTAVLPGLRAAGLSGADLEAMLVHTPRRVLARQPEEIPCR